MTGVQTCALLISLHQPLSLFAIEVIPELDVDEPGHALDVLSVVESVLENPGVVQAAQVNRLKSELVARLKMEGVGYEERMDRLAEVRPPRPLAEFLYGTFDVFRSHHPWVGDENVKPKSVAREMFEFGYGFRDYIGHHGLKRSEGTVLRYLTDAYKGLVQNVPPVARTDEVAERESTRLNSSHTSISYAVPCMTKKTITNLMLTGSGCTLLGTAVDDIISRSPRRSH